MAGTIRTIYEIATRGGTESEAQLRQVGKVGAEAFAKIDAAAKVVPTSLRAVDAAASQLKSSLTSATASAGPLGAALSAIPGPLGLISLAATGASAGVLALAKNAVAFGDNLADSAKSIGIGVEQLQALQFGAKLAGVETGTLESGLRKFVKAVGEAGLGTGDLAKKLEVLDPALLATLKNASSVDEAFAAMAAKIRDTKDPFEQATLATAAFGRSAVELLPLITNLDEMTKKARELGIIMGADLLHGADTAQDALDTLSATVKSNLTTALLALAPIIESTAGKLSSLAAQVGQFFQSSTGLGAVEAEISKLQNQKESINAQGFSSSGIDQQLADLRTLQQALRDKMDVEEIAARQKKKHADAEHAAFLKLQEDDDKRKQGERDEIAAQNALEAARKKAASEAEAAANRAAAQAKKNAEETIRFENEAAQAGLEGIALIEEKRDEALAEQQRRFDEGLIGEEDFNRRRVAINLAAEREITAVRQAEADKRAEEAQRDADRQAKAAARQAEKLAEELNRPVREAFQDIGRVGQDALEAFASGAHVTFQDIGNDLKATIIHALIEIAKQQVLLSIGANITGVGGGAGGAASGGAGLLQSGAQIISLGKSLLNGFETLGVDLGGLASSVLGLSSGIETLASSGIAITSVSSGASQGLASLALGGHLALEGGSVGSGATAGAGAAGAGASLAGAASTAGILIAVVAAIEGIMGVLNVSKTRDAAFGNADTRKAFMASFDPLTEQIANLTALISSGQNASNLFAQQQRILFGGASTGDKLQFAASLTATPLGPMLLPLLAFAAFTKPPTKGTALRKSFEEFIENKDLNAGFFSRDSGTFKRGIGQTGLSANDVHGGDLTAAARLAIGQGARGIQAATGLDFVAAQKEFIKDQQTSIGLTDKQLQEFTGLGAAFRALVGSKAGQEESRTFGIIADLLGSITAEGASAAEAMDLVSTAVAGLGRPQVVFEKLNDFFSSPENDIQVDTYRQAIQGLSAALFTDLPQGVDAAALALDELNKAGNGKVTFEQIANRIQAAAAEAEALGGALKDAFSAGLNDLQIDNVTFSENVFDSIHQQLKETIATAAFEGFTDGIFKGDVLGPFLATFKDTLAKVKSGELTQGDANQILADAAKTARDNLESFRPLIEQAIAAGRDLASIFDDAADSADKAKKAIADAFNQDISHQLLSILDPGLAAQFDLEVAQRNRLKAARDAGADLTKVEELNGLEREALAEQTAQKLTQIEEQRADQIARLMDSFFSGVERGLESVRDLVKSLTGSPSSPLPPEQALATAQSDFADLLKKAQGGDADALAKLPDAFNNVIGLAQELFGSTDKFFAIFDPLLAALQGVAGKDAHDFHVSKDTQAQIDAINKDAADQIATLNKHHDEAMALYQAMLEDLDKIVGKGGETPSDTVNGPGAGDQVSHGVPGPGSASSGRFGLGGDAQQRVQAALAGLHPGGKTEQELLALLSLQSFADVQTLAQIGSTQGQLAKEILQDFPGVRSLSGFDAVVNAYLGKIADPAKFQPVLGFADGGSFRYGGDTIPLIPGRVNVSRGETVTVTTSGIDGRLEQSIVLEARMLEELKSLNRRIGGLELELHALRSAYQHATSTPLRRPPVIG